MLLRLGGTTAGLIGPEDGALASGRLRSTAAADVAIAGADDAALAEGRAAGGEGGITKRSAVAGC
jgi:hypothetical protein